MRVNGYPIDASLKMHMLCRGATRTAFQCDGLSCSDGIPAFYQVLGVVAIDRFQPKWMAHHDDIAIASIFARQAHHAIESAAHGIIGKGLDIHPRVVGIVSVPVGYQIAPRQRKAEPQFQQVVRADVELAPPIEQPWGRGAHIAHLTFAESLCLALCYLKHEAEGADDTYDKLAFQYLKYNVIQI